MAMVIFSIYYVLDVSINDPEINDLSLLEAERKDVSDQFRRFGNSWLKKNDGGIWEMYLEGDPFERGVAHGKLAEELVQVQEDYFIAEIKKLIPSEGYLNFIKYFVAWMNRDIDEYIDPEFQQEIFGVSRAASSDYDFIAPAFDRMMNYHGAHDIGHALANMNLVGCTSFSTWTENPKDSALLIARNFDFYFGEDFSKEKIVCFVNPDEGHKFMMITWGGFIGAVSGMNEKGVTVTLNAAASAPPTKGKTPISLVSRKILQYAANITEAKEIAEEYETYVSESLMIGSAEDYSTALLEKSPEETILFESSSNLMICSNHFQSAHFANSTLTIENKENSDSPYRYARMQQLLQQSDSMTVENAIEILRNRNGVDDKLLGYGNQNAINQLIAHHGIVFQPMKQQFWISTYPYQIGEFYTYRLNFIFNRGSNFGGKSPVNDTSQTIPPDPFLNSPEFQTFQQFKQFRQKIKLAIEDDEVNFTDENIDVFIATNPEYYHTYQLVGDFLKARNRCPEAIEFYQQALTKEIATIPEEQKIKAQIEACSKN